MPADAAPLHGACHCGAVAYRADPPFPPVIFCHCGQCRNWSGHYWASSSVPLDRFHLTEMRGLAWFTSSDRARRGFCRDCGASLFWQPLGEARICFAAGSVAKPSGLVPGAHIFTGDAGDYYAPEGPPPATAAHHAAAPRLSAACLCGACAFTLPGPAGAVGACHCNQCRSLSGHYTASFDAAEAALDWTARAGLAEYPTPGGGRRGFCRDCGSSLYFRSAEGAFSVEAGALRGPSGGWLESHIFTADKGDYYSLDDGLPQYPGWD